MSHTAHKNDRMMEEIFMSEQEIKDQCQKVADLVNKSKRIIFFTGAGLSTASNIGDYRSSKGLWTLSAQGRESEFKSKPLHLAQPNTGHMAIVEFQNRNKLSCVISQNVDGLHRRSGINNDLICELHGNSAIEECADCGKQHHRDISISGDRQHFTGRNCVACGGKLRDSIINFGENLNPRILEKAYHVSREGDLHICLGSSLAVSPANDLPRETKRNGGKVVIINLQRTPLDAECDIRLHCKINDFFACLFEKLNWKTPDWTLRRQVSLLKNNNINNNTPTVRFCASLPGTDIPSSSFGVISLVDPNDKKVVLEKKDFTMDASAMNDICPTFNIAKVEHCPTFVCESFFMKERQEPSFVELSFPTTADDSNGNNNVITFDISTTFDEASQKFSPWKIVKADTATPPNLERGTGATRVEGIRSKTSNNDDKSNKEEDYSGWFAVTPISDCAHTSEIKFTEGAVFDIHRPCEDCGVSGEVMQCFTCNKTFCGRYVKGHMLKHHEETGHAIVCGFRDLSVWCFKCDAYLKEDNQKVAPLHRLLYAQKFGTEEPQVMVDSAAAGVNKSRRQKPKHNVDPSLVDDNDDDQQQQDQNEKAPPQRRDRVAGGGQQEVDTKYKEELDESMAKRSGFAVQPIPSCPHTNENCVRLQENAVFDIESPCETCGNVGENWFCLKCNKTFCSRYVNGCMQKHQKDDTAQDGTHALAISYSDLSVWCTVCEEYINGNNQMVQPMVKLMTLAKFGDE